jgi:hypothetical protein
LGTTTKYLRGAAGNDRAKRSSTCDAQRAALRATAWAPQLVNTALRRTTSAAWGNKRPGHQDQVPATHNERRRGQGPGATAKYLRCTTSGVAGIGLGTTIKYLRGAAGFGLGTTIKYLRGAAGIGLRTTIKYLRRSTSGAAGNGLCTTIKYLRGAAGIGLGSTAKYLRRTTSTAAGNGLSTTIKYLVNQNAGAGKTGPRPTTKRLGTYSA